MKNHNGIWEQSSDPALLDSQIDALKEKFRALIERAGSTETGEPTRIARLADRATTLITAHPFAAVAAALGLGYVSARIATRGGR